MNKIIWLAIIIGFILGPVYYVYARYLSGQAGQTETLLGKTRDSNGGVNAPSWQKGIVLHLKPSMNPIALELKEDGMVPRLKVYGKAVSRYRASLTLQGNRLWNEEWVYGFQHRSLRTHGDREGVIDSIIQPIHHSRLKTFNVHEAGDYAFHFEQVEEDPVLRLRELKVQVVKNVKPVNYITVGLGGTILAIGVLTGYRRMQQAS